MTEERLKQIQELTDKATPGPWKARGRSAASGMTSFGVSTPWPWPYSWVHRVAECKNGLHYRFETREYEFGDNGEIGYWREDERGEDFFEPCSVAEQNYEQMKNDLYFIAMAREAIPELLAEVRALEAENRDMLAYYKNTEL